MTDVLVIIPAYNESANIETVVGRLNSICPDYDYVVVNDGSTDSTAEICRRCGFNLLDLPVNLGLAGGFQAGLRYAARYGYRYAIQIDGEDGRVVGLEIEGVTPYRHSEGFIDDPLVPVRLIPSSGIGADVNNHEVSAVGRELPIHGVDITCVPIGFLYFDCRPLSHEHLRGLLFRGGTVGLVVAAGGGEQGGHRAERRQECEMKFCFHD